MGKNRLANHYINEASFDYNIFVCANSDSISMVKIFRWHTLPHFCDKSCHAIAEIIFSYPQIKSRKLRILQFSFPSLWSETKACVLVEVYFEATIFRCKHVFHATIASVVQCHFQYDLSSLSMHCNDQGTYPPPPSHVQEIASLTR